MRRNASLASMIRPSISQIKMPMMLASTSRRILNVRVHNRWPTGEELSGFLERLPAGRGDESSQRLVDLRQQVTQQTGVGEEGVRCFTLQTASRGLRLETIDVLLQRFCALR